MRANAGQKATPTAPSQPRAERERPCSTVFFVVAKLCLSGNTFAATTPSLKNLLKINFI
jgi:hypothetical protein